MMARTASVVPSAAMSHVVVGRCGVWGCWLVAGGTWQKLGRTGRQDKSRDVRLGWSGRWRFEYNSFDMHLAMCARDSRCAAMRDRPILLERTHLAGVS